MSSLCIGMGICKHNSEGLNVKAMSMHRSIIVNILDPTHLVLFTGFSYVEFVYHNISKAKKRNLKGKELYSDIGRCLATAPMIYTYQHGSLTADRVGRSASIRVHYTLGGQPSSRSGPGGGRPPVSGVEGR